MKEQILTFTYLKEVDVKGVGPKKILALGAAVQDSGLELKSLVDLAILMSEMKDKAIRNVTLSNLNEAQKLAEKIMEVSYHANIGLVGYYDIEYPDALRKTVDENGKPDPPLLLWYRGDLSEYRIGTSVNRYNLVARDRLQAGLVIQTGENGGTMHAAYATLKGKKPLYTMLFRDDTTNKHKKCLGNAHLVKLGAKYIKGSDNLDEIMKQIKNWEPVINNLFDF